MDEKAIWNGLTTLLAVGLTLLGCGDAKPDDVAKDFYSAVAKQDVDKAYKMLYLSDKDENKEMQVKGKLQMIVGEMSGKIEQHGGTKDIAVKKVTIGETTANVILEVTFKDKIIKEESFRLRKKKDEWKVVLR